MKTWFALTLLLVGFVTASAQDTLQVNSDTVTKKFENERVRVLESLLKVNEKEHSHPRYVTYVADPGRVRCFREGTKTEIEFKRGEVLYRAPQTHWCENIGSTAPRVVLFELKESNAPGRPFKVPAEKDPVKLSPQYYKVPVDNEFVRVLEYTLKPGQKEPMHSHPCGVVYYLTGAKWRTTSADGKTSESDTTAGTILWRDPTTHAAENVGKTVARAIAIEIKGNCGQ